MRELTMTCRVGKAALLGRVPTTDGAACIMRRWWARRPALVRNRNSHQAPLPTLQCADQVIE
jgi:hypothetical protein